MGGLLHFLQSSALPQASSQAEVPIRGPWSSILRAILRRTLAASPTAAPASTPRVTSTAASAVGLGVSL